MHSVTKLGRVKREIQFVINEKEGNLGKRAIMNVSFDKNKWNSALTALVGVTF